MASTVQAPGATRARSATAGTPRAGRPRRAIALATAALAALVGLAPVTARAAEAPRTITTHPPVVLLEQPVRVVASLADDHSGVFLATIVVSHGERRFELRSVVVGAPSDTAFAAAIAELRRSTGWRDRFLFVGTFCGSGNSWKCASEAVFVLAEGKLAGLGSLPAREGAGFGTSYREGAFHDLDSDLEINRLTSRALAPRIEVLLRERNGQLVGDADGTWALNAVQFALNDSLAHVRTGSEVVGYKPTWEFAISPRLENAMLAKYCGRVTALDSIVAEARRALPQEIMPWFERMIARIEPGAPPTRSRLLPSPGN